MPDPIDTEALRREHVPVKVRPPRSLCRCGDDWPCDVLALLDEIDRLNDVVAAMDAEVAEAHADLLAKPEPWTTTDEDRVRLPSTGDVWHTYKRDPMVLAVHDNLHRLTHGGRFSDPPKAACFDCALRAVVAVRSMRLVPITEENQ